MDRLKPSFKIRSKNERFCDESIIVDDLFEAQTRCLYNGLTRTGRIDEIGVDVLRADRISRVLCRVGVETAVWEIFEDRTDFVDEYNDDDDEVSEFVNCERRERYYIQFYLSHKKKILIITGNHRSVTNIMVKLNFPSPQMSPNSSRHNNRLNNPPPQHEQNKK